MREILFRGKREDNNEWIYGDYSHFFVDDRKYIYITSWGKITRSVHSETVGQYTGLKDKNGVKIFEGDIVEIPREDEYFKIEWEEDLARFVLRCSSFVCDFDNYWGYETEVIGNIYDNPELLEASYD